MAQWVYFKTVWKKEGEEEEEEEEAETPTSVSVEKYSESHLNGRRRREYTRSICVFFSVP